MRRGTFDYLVSAGGVLIVIVLLVAGGLLMWGYSFANSSVHDQLAKQQIFFPTAAQCATPKAGTEITPSMVGTVCKYAGQQLLTGQQAKVYADDFIAVHLSEMPYNGVYAKVSDASRANPNDADLGRRGANLLPGHHPAGSAARGLRLLDLRSDRLLGCHRRLLLGVRDGRPGRIRVLARPAHRTRGRAAGR